MTKILKMLFILQEVNNKNKNPKLGKGFFNAYRLNPYNPLSYVTVVFMIIVGIVMFGIIGFWKDLENPFKWN